MQSIKNTILKEDLAKIFADFTEKKNCGIAQYSLLDARDFWVIIFCVFLSIIRASWGLKKLSGLIIF